MPGYVFRQITTKYFDDVDYICGAIECARICA